MKNFIIVFIFLVTSSVFAAIDEPVEISTGKISGITLDTGVQAFLGIPYAAAPVGDLRCPHEPSRGGLRHGRRHRLHGLLHLGESVGHDLQRHPRRRVRAPLVHDPLVLRDLASGDRDCRHAPQLPRHGHCEPADTPASGGGAPARRGHPRRGVSPRRARG